MPKSQSSDTRYNRVGMLTVEHRYHVERFLREVIIPRLAPISREMCLNYISERVLDLPKSY